MMSGVPRVQTSDRTMNFQNLRELLEARAAASPEKVFLFSEADGRRFTYREFDAAVNRAANMLAARGTAKGGGVSLLLPIPRGSLLAFFPVFTVAALAVPVNSLMTPEEMPSVVGNPEARLLLYNSQ